MGKLLPIILVVVGLVGGVGAGLFLRPVAEEAAMAECVDASASHEVAEPAHGEEATANAHGAPEEPPQEADCVETVHEPSAAASGGHGAEASGLQYAKLSNQFVVPVVSDGRVSSLIVLSLSIEVDASLLETIFSTEPKLRDAFLTVMFLHANSGGFNGEFTRKEPMSDLRGSLREAAQKILGPSVNDVLITEIVRQDV